ncbi:MAG: transposase [Candidatus Auribacterota bacterium]|nr:transposase [Candidatus Auribacterota bacterium]
MPRANRHHIPGYIWHITHRCHKKEFLLKFPRDRRRWIHWLYEARKRYGLCILNFMVTSNHIHLLVVDGDDEDTIPRSMQLVEGRVAQEYNYRKERKGAFWEDRYHATAVQSGKHLVRCMSYIDLNMVRAGIVRYPSEWEFCGYKSIQNPPKRYQIIDRNRLAELLKLRSVEELAQQQKSWVKTSMEGDRNRRDSKWSESIAVGDLTFVNDVMDKLGARSIYREVVEEDGISVLREPKIPYSVSFTPKTGPLSPQNTYFWDSTD